MADENTAGKSAARALEARTPGWMIWYGRHTGSFWAAPRVKTPVAAQLLEASTTEELDRRIRQAEGRPPRQESRPARSGRQQEHDQNEQRDQNEDGDRQQRRDGDEQAQARHQPTVEVPRVPVRN